MSKLLSEGKVCEPGLVEVFMKTSISLWLPLSQFRPHCVVLSLLSLSLPPDRSRDTCLLICLILVSGAP